MRKESPAGEVSVASRRPLPNVVGCAIGFCAAGSGIGSLVGTALGPWLYPPLPEGQGTQEDQILAMYGGTYLGIMVGMAAGAVAGVLYAVLVRRARLRVAESGVPHARAGDASSGSSSLDEAGR